MTALPAPDALRLTRDGLPLVLHFHRPATLHAWALILHGFGEHGGRYAPMVSALADAGIACAVPDHRGHGRSGGRRGHVGRFDQYLDDLDAWLLMLREQTGLNAFTIVGHSFGGLLALAWALRKPLGLVQVVALSPQLGLRLHIPWYKRLVASVLLPLVPTLALPNGIDATGLAHDPRVAETYRSDPLVHDRVTLRAYQAMQTGMDTTRRRAREFILPLSIFVGSEDPIVDVQACRQWYEMAASPQKAFRSYPGCYHELHHEAVAPELFAAIRGAVLNHAAS